MSYLLAASQRRTEQWYRSTSDPSQQTEERAPFSSSQPEAGPSRLPYHPKARSPSPSAEEQPDSSRSISLAEFLHPYLYPPSGKKPKPIPEWIFEVSEEARRELEVIKIFGLDLDEDEPMESANSIKQDSRLSHTPDNIGIAAGNGILRRSPEVSGAAPTPTRSSGAHEPMFMSGSGPSFPPASVVPPPPGQRAASGLDITQDDNEEERALYDTESGDEMQSGLLRQ